MASPDTGATHAVLIIEDHPDQRSLLEIFLQKEEYHVIVAEDGIEALKKLDNETPDIILCDIRMPRMDGLEFIRKLRNNSAFRNTYVILITGRFQESDLITGLELGADDCLTKPFHLTELLARIRAGSRVVEYKKQIEHQALVDFVTGLSNRRAFENKLDEEFTRATRYGHPLSLLILDVDDFKRINDTHGHYFGDKVLQKIAENLQAKTRRSDYPARYGGDEFVLILPEGNLESAYQAGDKIRKEIKALRFEASNGAFSVTLSIGISSTSEKPYSNWNLLIQDADEALYVAKMNGKDQLQASISGGYSRAASK